MAHFSTWLSSLAAKACRNNRWCTCWKICAEECYTCIISSRRLLTEISKWRMYSCITRSSNCAISARLPQRLWAMMVSPKIRSMRHLRVMRNTQLWCTGRLRWSTNINGSMCQARSIYGWSDVSLSLCATHSIHLWRARNWLYAQLIIAFLSQGKARWAKRCKTWFGFV